MGVLPNIPRTILSFAFVCGTAFSVCAGDVPEKKQTKLGLYLTAAEAQEMLSSGDAVFVDVRSRAEVAFLGIPKRADIHIPYMVMPMMAVFNEEKIHMTSSLTQTSQLISKIMPQNTASPKILPSF
ncbi:rhodanese-like domain-containing protein [Sulfitobacter sediminilitoris]|uniref:rhodanese-like domain-containing protein n=1 Tax=Sulfitobacter sediminilitoris TaxID=2698830 RepID=UPI003615E7B6